MYLTAFCLVFIASIYLVIGLWIFGRKKPHYNHLRHTISELGETGAVHERQVSRMVFLPVGVLLLLVAYLVQPLSMVTAGLALCIAIGYVVAAFFPCDVGSPLTGSTRQAVHNLGGTAEYLGGGLTLLELAKQMDPILNLAAYFVLAAGVAISVTQLGAVRGLIQRLAEACLFGGLALAIWHSGAIF